MKRSSRMAITDAAGFFERVKATLVRGSSARTRMGTFFVQTVPAYEGRNPRTGQAITVSPASTVAFVPSDELTTSTLGPRAFQTHAEGLALLEREAAEAGATLAAPTEVGCSDSELAACVRALGAELAPDHRVEIAPLGTLVLRLAARGEALEVQLRAAPELLSSTTE